MIGELRADGELGVKPQICATRRIEFEVAPEVRAGSEVVWSQAARQLVGRSLVSRSPEFASNHGSPYFANCGCTMRPSCVSRHPLRISSLRSSLSVLLALSQKCVTHAA